MELEYSSFNAFNESIDVFSLSYSLNKNKVMKLLLFSIDFWFLVCLFAFSVLTGSWDMEIVLLDSEW